MAFYTEMISFILSTSSAKNNLIEYFRHDLVLSTSTPHEIKQSNPTQLHITQHHIIWHRIETENSRAAAEKASRGIQEDAKAPIGFIEVKIF